MRIRSIKPEFWRSQDVADLPRDLRLLWIGLWSYVDDNGVGVDDHRIIAAELFALDDPIEARQFVRDGLARLSRLFRIARYTVDGRSYLYVNGWDKHQRIDKPGKPRYPRPPADYTPPEPNETPGHEPENPDHNNGFATPSRDTRDSLAPGTEEQGNRGTEEKASTRAGAHARGTRARDNTTHKQLAATAVKPGAYTLVSQWHQQYPDAPPYLTETIRALSKTVDELLSKGARADLVRAALDEWDARTDVHSPGALHWLYRDAVKAARGTRSGRQDGRQTRGDKVNGWLALNDDPDAPQPKSARGDKVRGWLDLEDDQTPALTAITGGLTA